MSREPIGADSLDKLPRPPRYRILILDKDDRVLRMEAIAVSTDDEALSRARMLVDGHAVELWDGVRFIEHFKPVDQQLRSTGEQSSFTYVKAHTKRPTELLALAVLGGSLRVR